MASSPRYRDQITRSSEVISKTAVERRPESPSRPMGRTPAVLLAWSAGAIKTVVTMLVGFVATPYLLIFLGAERIGALRTAQQWSGYLPYMNFGLPRALEVLLLEAANQNDPTRLAGLTKTSIRLQARQTLFAMMPIALLLAWFMPVLVPVTESLKTELRVGAFIGTLLALASPFEMFRSVLAFLRLSYLVGVAMLVQSLVATGLSVPLAWLGYGIPGQYAAQGIAVMITCALYTMFAVRHLPEFASARAVEIKPHTLRSLRQSMTLTSMSAHLNQMTDYIVIGWVLSPAYVTMFLLTQRFVDTLGGYATHNVATSSWTVLSEVLKSEGCVAFQRRLLELVRVLLGFGTIVVGTLAAYNAHFITQWVGYQYYGGDLLSILTAVQLVVFGWVALFNLVVDGQGDARDRAGISMAGALLNVGMSFVLAWWLGLYGVTLASIVACLAGDAWISPYTLCRRYGVKPKALISTALKALCLASVWVAALWYVVHREAVIGSWLLLSSELAIATSSGVLYFVVVILTSEDRRTWVNRIRGVATRRSADR